MTWGHLQLQLSGGRPKEGAAVFEDLSTLLRWKRSSIKAMKETELGNKPAPHWKRRHESRKNSINVRIYQCGDNRYLSISGTSVSASRNNNATFGQLGPAVHHPSSFDSITISYYS